MENKIFSDDHEDNGKTLTEGEFINALIKRSDIFHINKNKQLFIIEFICIALGLFLGFLIVDTPLDSVSHDFYEKGISEHWAKLFNGKVFSLKNTQGYQKEPAPVSEPTIILDKFLSINATALHPNKQAPIPKAVEYSRHSVAQRNLPTDSPLSKPVSFAKTPVRSNSKDSMDNTDLINQADALKKQQNYGKAIDNFKKILTRDPANFHALSELGESFLFSGLLDSATQFYHKAVAINPNNSHSHNGLGLSYFFTAATPTFTYKTEAFKKSAGYIKSQYDSAIMEYTHAIMLDSGNVEALVNRGLAHDATQDRREAIKDYSRAIEIKPSFADAYVKRAAAYKESGRLSEAVEDYSRAIKLDSSSYLFNPTLHFANAYFDRGNAFYQLGKFDNAIADYDSALRLTPKNPLAMINKARALSDTKMFDSALAYFTKGIILLAPTEYHNAKEHAFMSRGLVYSQTDRYEKAIKDFESALSLDSSDYFVYLHKGNAEKALRKLDNAISDFSIAFKSSGLKAKLCWRIAECYGLKKDKPLALQWLNRSVESGFNNFNAWKNDKDLSMLWDDSDFIALLMKH